MQKLLLIVLLAALLSGCGPAAAPACSVEEQAACPANALTYDTGIGTLLSERCSPCHAAGGVEAQRLLTDYAHVSGLRMSIASQLVTCSMPPAGAPQLSASERQQVLDWLTCGAKK